MNATTAQLILFPNTDGLTSLLVIGAALGALTMTVLAAAWQVAVPMFSLLPAIVSALT